MFNSVGENRQLVQVTGGSSHFQVSKRQKCIIDNSIKKSDAVLREFTAKQTISKWLEITWTLSSSTKGKHVIVKTCIEWEFCQVRDVNKICKWHEIVGKITLREPYTNYDTFLINKFVFENTFLIFWGSRTLFLDFWIFFCTLQVTCLLIHLKKKPIFSASEGGK